MKKLLIMVTTTLFLTGLATVQSCRKHHTDPCNGLTPVSANFSITVDYDKTDPAYAHMIAIDCDTILGPNDNGTANFKAKETGAAYDWKIGSGEYNTQSLFLKNFPTRQRVPIQLIVQKEPNKNCFPNDDGKDTLVRYVYNIGETYRAAFVGNWLGRSDEPGRDTFTVRLVTQVTADGVNPYHDSDFSDRFDGIYVKDLCPNCAAKHDWSTAAYKQFKFGPGVNTTPTTTPVNACRGITGMGYVLGTDSIVIYYSIYEAGKSYPNGKYLNYIFRGHRK